MFRRVRRKLALIRYYSADRNSGPWARAADLSLVVGLLLAALVVFLAEVLVEQEISSITYRGALAEAPDGAIIAIVSEEGVWFREPDGRPYGDFTIRVTSDRRGLVVATAFNEARAVLDLNLFDEIGTHVDARLDADDPARLAIEAALDRRSIDIRLGGAGKESGIYRRQWTGTALVGALWWLILTAFLIAGLRIARLLVLSHKARAEVAAAKRAAAGRCHACNYDVRGLDFHERCPECGALMQ